MARYIEEGALVSKLDWDNDIKKWTLYDDDLEQLPTADVVEVKHEYWKLTKTEFGWNGCEYPTEYTCTVCGGISPCCEESYCPNCGAKMDGRRDT